MVGPTTTNSDFLPNGPIAEVDSWPFIWTRWPVLGCLHGVQNVSPHFMDGRMTSQTTCNSADDMSELKEGGFPLTV